MENKNEQTFFFKTCFFFSPEKNSDHVYNFIDLQGSGK